MLKKFFVGTVVALLTFSFIGEETFARRGGSFGGGRSFSGGSRSSRGFSSRSSGQSSRSRSFSSGSRRSKGTAKPSARSKAKAQRRSYEKAKASGKAYTNKSSALKGYRSKFKSDPKTRAAFNKKYPTTYSKQPATRPSHIPQSYQGNTVIYQGGGYGYMHNGVFTMLTGAMLMSTMSDAMLMSHMRHQGYHIGPAPAVVGMHWGWYVFWTVFSILMVFAFLGLLFRNSL